MNKSFPIDARLNLDTQTIVESHRSGWADVLAHIADLHSDEGTMFDGFLERRFGWNLNEHVTNGVLPYTRDWVGVLHNPPNMPEFWERKSSPERLLASIHFQQSLERCHGIFVLSDYLKNWLEPRVDVQVVSLKHPTPLDVPQFSMQQYRDKKVKQIVQLGFWLRRFQSLKHLALPNFVKLCIIPHAYAIEYRELEERYTTPYNQYGESQVGRYQELKWLPNDIYDNTLRNSIVFLDLYDSSANNAILECIARATPVLVNPLPAVVEYLGDDYPLYFRSLQEAESKASDIDCIQRAHDYLKALDKRPFSYSEFRQQLVNSTIYQSLPKSSDGTLVTTKIAAKVDTLDDLNLIAGEPLANAYVFVICFRNIEDKLVRCVESICKQNIDFDFGVVLVDDCSDRGVNVAVFDLLAEHNIPFAHVVNKQRKYFTRNLYNAVNFLVSNDNSVIIELDGDDYLEDTDVLKRLEEEYSSGAEKTFGSCRCVPKGTAIARSVEAYKELDEHDDISQPWNLDVCLSWLHLKTYTRELFRRVPLNYFLERGGARWLRMGEDLVIHPKMIELAGPNTRFIEDVLYVYDVSGGGHDIQQSKHAVYLTEKLFRTPIGSYIAECQVRKNKYYLAPRPAYIYDAVVSLGRECMVSYQLDRLGLRSFSGPLDWFIIEIEGLLKLCESRFEQLFSRDQLILDGEGVKGYWSVVDVDHEACSTHEFAHKKDEQPLYDYAINKSQIDRRVKRLLELLDSEADILFVRSFADQQQATDLLSKLQDMRTGMGRTDMICLNTAESLTLGSEQVQKTPTLRFEQISGVGDLRSDPDTWRGVDAEWDQIFANISIRSTGDNAT